MSPQRKIQLCISPALRVLLAGEEEVLVLDADVPGGNCIKIGLPGKLILGKRKGLLEVLFS